MILTKTVKVKVNTKTDRTYYEKGYYNKEKCNDEISLNIKIDDLIPSSREKILVKCDICGTQKEISYYKYLQNIKKYNIYSCSSKCSSFKVKKTKKKKYNNENYNNREKSKQTCLKKYNCENPQQNKEIKEKTKHTNIIKYGGSSPRSSSEIQEKQRKTTIEKYGKDYYIMWRKIIKEKLFEKYNDENYNNREKSKATCLKKYNCENPMKNLEIKKKAKESRMKNGTYYTEEERTTYKNYWLEVKKVTNKHKKELFEKWNGKDYYDDEYIKDNFLLDSGNRLYPTIDHKISISYGFRNNISPDIIGNIINLCVTKRYINSSKNSKNKYDINK